MTRILLCCLCFLVFVGGTFDDGLPLSVQLRAGSLSPSNQSLFGVVVEDGDQKQFLMEDYRWGPLLTKHQILVSLQEDFEMKTQEKVISKLQEFGGLFVAYIPHRAFLFLGNSQTQQSVMDLEEVHWTGSFLPAYKISPEWSPVLKLLKKYNLQELSEYPVHALHKDLEKSEMESLIGHLFVDKTREPYRLVIEVQFPTFHRTQIGLNADWNSTYSPAKAAEIDWLPSLQQKYGNEVEMKAFHGTLDVYVPGRLVEDILYELSLQTAVHRLHPKTRTKLHNWKASGIIQSGLVPPEEDGKVNVQFHPIWAAGIQGEGQIVGCGDSGIDVDSCFFYDPEVPFREERPAFRPNGFEAVFESEDHRKIKYYAGAVDTLDNDGHGTHVVGTLVGNPIDDSDPVALANRGMAPEAKISFMDLGGHTTSNGEEDSESIYTPTELSTYYYPVSYTQGARIHSDSWGSDSPAYDHLAQEVDKYVWENDDFLPVFAAGNYGRLSADFLTTVTSPAVAKNCLSVGATLTAGQSTTRRYNSNIQAYRLEVRISVSEDEYEGQEYKILGAEFGAPWEPLFSLSTQQNIELVLGTPETGCTTLQNNIKDKVVLLMRGECQFVQKLKNAQAREALGVIVMNNLENGYFGMQGTNDTPNSELTVPMASIPLSIGEQLKTVLESKRRVTLVVHQRSEPQNSYDNIADFSSGGPTLDNRIKPDIVAPGRTKSVWSDGKFSPGNGQCLMRTASGTSMATPVVAGAAVLVRQYYTDGYYPTGEKTPENEFIPSAALIKATMLGGAFAMDGYTEAGLPLEPPPSSRQGFGRVNLETSIPVQSSAKWKDGWKLQVVDRALLGAEESHKYCIRASGGPLRVTLVWTDPPASTTAGNVLVNDLDLSVKSAGLKGIELLGNGREDHRNNVERVLVEDMPEGNVAIVVKAHHIVAAYSQQPYALVVQGEFNGILQSAYNPYQSETQNAKDLCIITLAVLESGPEGPINDKNPEFTFTTQSGAQPVNGFECKLTDIHDQKNDEPLHDWEPCTSPEKYENLPDKEYTFTVRPKNEDVEVSRSFIVDTESPRTEIKGDPIPTISSQESVQLHFEANDLTAVSYSCKLEFDGNRRKSSLRLTREDIQDPNVELDTWYRCSSPQNFRGLTHGNWTFKVRGEDEAGNNQVLPTEYPWTIQFSPNVYYVRTIEAPLEVTPYPTLSFSFQAITGDLDGHPIVLEEEQTECRLYLTMMESSGVPFRDCERPIIFSNVSDGQYTFEARTKDARGHQGSSVSTIYFSVDSTAPVISLLEKPRAFHGAQDVIIKFEANEEVSGYSCSMRRRNSPVSFVQCPGTEPGTVDYQLEDGKYTFQAVAQDLAGNEGFSERLEFLIDSKPPQISFNHSDSLASNQSEVSLEFKMSDGGSGIAQQNVSCSLLDEISQATIREFPGCFSPVNYDLEEGSYLFTVEAVDRAGHRQEESLQVKIDFTPPVINWTSTLSSEPQPPFVIFQFSGSDEPKNMASLVSYFECKLQEAAVDREEKTIFEESGNRRRLTNLHPSSIQVRGLLQAAGTNQSSSKRTPRERVKIKDGPYLPYNKWTRCQSPAILTEIKSGEYSFQVRAVDFAENIGESNRVYTFTVDDTLPIPGLESSSDNDLDLSMKVVIGLVGAFAFFLLCVCVLVICCRRKQKEKQIIRAPQRITSLPMSASDRAPTSYGVGQPHPEAYSSASSGEHMLNPARKTSLTNPGLTSSLYYHQHHQHPETESQRMRHAIDASMEDYRYKQAIERSINDR